MGRGINSENHFTLETPSTAPKYHPMLAMLGNGTVGFKANKEVATTGTARNPDKSTTLVGCTTVASQMRLVQTQRQWPNLGAAARRPSTRR